jgi:hypothetical protein
MIYILALVPATILTIAGYGVLFLAHRSDRGLKIVGRYLGFWAFTLAALIVLAGIIGAVRGQGMHDMMMWGSAQGGPRSCPYMHPWRQPPARGGSQVAPAPPLPPAESPPGAPPR